MLGSCSQNIERIERGNGPPPPPPPFASNFQPGTEASAEELLARGTPPGVTGEIRITEELAGEVGPNAALFVFARTQDGAPIAAKRLAHPTFPLRFFLGQESVMFEGQTLEGQIDLQVRVSQSGTAGPPSPGDLLGSCADNPITIGDSQVHEVLIDSRQ